MPYVVNYKKNYICLKMTKILLDLREMFHSIHDTLSGRHESTNEDYNDLKQNLYSSLKTPKASQDKANLKNDIGAIGNDLRNALSEYEKRK